MGTPVVGATVTLFHTLEADGHPNRESSWQTRVSSEEDGVFSLRDYAAPGKVNLVGLEVTAPGYHATFRTYLDYADTQPQLFVVFLRPRS
ncbi:MAG: hypothetical protein GY769_10920 [bacterium]|nr:hypothetical protein [bacterium]